MAEEKAYTQAAGTGKYDKTTGLLGKYDNVRRFWEDQITGLFMRPALNELVNRKRKHLERIRVVDLGCGSGDGYELLMDVNNKEPGIYEHITAAITSDMLKQYIGVDINEDLLKQARECHGHNPKLSFIRADMSDGLPSEITEEEPFDIYLTTYGTLSHFHDEQCVKMISDVCRHAPSRALFIGDWLGRYTYEWQDLWHHPVDEEYFMDYRISYIYPEEERHKVHVPSFPLRLMCQDEIRAIIGKAAAEAGVKINMLACYDRSVLIGRHMDTGEYNRNCPKMIRAKVNSLFEGYLRTDLESLLIDHVPRPGYPHLNNFFEMFFISCNALVEYTIDLLSGYDAEAEKPGRIPDIHPFYAEPLKEAMNSMRRVVEGVGWLKWGDARANVIEPCLGYCLRKLEMELQQGLGMGHGIVGVFEIIK